jgi:DNA-binding NarL/FixJ family response regulator
MSLPHQPNRPEQLWQPAPVRALIADDSELYSEALALTLELEPGIEVVGRARDGTEAVELALSLRPDVVLMDLDMPVLDGIEATKAVLYGLPETRVVMVTASADEDDRLRAEEAGVSAYVRKGGFAGELFDAIFGSRERSARPGASEAQPERPPARSPARPPRRRGPTTMRALRAFQ